MSVRIQERDEREITVPIPATEAEVERFGEFLVRAGLDGYTLREARTLQGGHQLDPTTTGLRITVAK